MAFSTVTVYPKGSEDEIEFTDVDAISLVNDDTYGPAPVFHNDPSFEGTVLYVNPQNISAMEATK